MTDRRHYICELRLDGGRAFILWFEGDRDGIARRPDGTIALFSNVESAREYGAPVNLKIAPDAPTVFDLEPVVQWCEAPTAEAVDCEAFLNAWNLFGDLRLGDDSLFATADRHGGSIYDKLFFGNNLPSVTSVGEQYEPSWDDQELAELARLMRLGLTALRKELATAAA